MGFNLSVRCNVHKEEMGILRGHEPAGIARFRGEHPRATCGDLESNIDNGYEAEEWGPDEGYTEKVYPDDYPPKSPTGKNACGKGSSNYALV